MSDCDASYHFTAYWMLSRARSTMLASSMAAAAYRPLTTTRVCSRLTRITMREG